MKIFNIWAGVGPAGQFRVHEFLVLFITTLIRIYFSVRKQAKMRF